MTAVSVRYRMLLIVGLTLLAAAYVLPTVSPGVAARFGFLAKRRLNLGLDLRGGTHLVLTVDVDKAVENALDLTRQELRRELRKAGVRPLKIERQDARLVLRVPPEQRSKVSEVIKDRFPNLQLGAVAAEDGMVRQELTFPAREADRIREAAVEQSLETIRNRVDQFGVTEPIIQRQGARDILIQLPGVQNPERAKDLIGRTAVLEFKLVRDDPNVEDYASGRRPLPPGTEILYLTEKDQYGRRRRGSPLLVESRTLMTGDVVTDARVRPGDLPNERIVLLTLNSRGARIFEDITRRNVGRRLAIILDNNVYSAPVIREPIPGGRAVISGSFTPEEARDLAIVLRTGALPAPVHIAEERTVGPTLGRDSIRRGLLSFAVGGALVVLFMLVYYRFAGLLADAALGLNVLYLFGTLAGFGATLTLPGIAGIVLTLGMAVDANVLINERIREELRLGKTARAAIEAGYERALPAILDSNITTFLAGLILFQFGSGPIKGFAVTLCIGIVSSVFTAVVGTRVVYDYLISRGRLRTVSI